MASEGRKEKVIHTRIPAALEEQIKRLAEGLRVPVSNLVRNMLEDAIEMTRRMRDRVPAPHDPPTATMDLSGVFGWQEITLNIDAPCARCEKLLQGGDQAFLGLTDRSRDARVFICPECVPRPVKNDRRRKASM
ncbi:MAG: hypothetical protein HY698_17185 [Deltaproteobacteria bacterium]|nr:hypothetical protein [Deltaproteobacteria bacterium]